MSKQHTLGNIRCQTICSELHWL